MSKDFVDPGQSLTARMLQFLPDAYASPVVALDCIHELARRGRVHILSSLLLTGSGFVNLLLDATQSQTDISIFRLIPVLQIIQGAQVSVPTPLYLNLMVQPTTNLPALATQHLPANARIGGPQSGVRMRSAISASAMSGGVVSDVGFMLQPGVGRQVVDLPPIILPKGVKLGLTGALPSAGTAQFGVSLYFHEDWS